MKTTPLFALALLALAACQKTPDDPAPGPPPAPTLTLSGFRPQQAEEGDEITLSGRLFSRNTAVAFNGVAAKNVFFLSDSTLGVVVPEGASTGKITLSDAGRSVVSAQDFTVTLPLSAKATVVKLADVPAFGNTGADALRMSYWGGNHLFVTGPAQNTVYRLDLTTLGVAPFLTNLDRPVGILAGQGDLLHVGSSNQGHYYAYDSGKLSKSDSYNAVARPWSLKGPGPLFPTYSALCLNFSNELVGLKITTYGGNTASDFKATVINNQLRGIPSEASAHLAVSGNNVFVFANHALWKLQPDNSLKLVAGAAGQSGYADGPATTARFRDGGYGRGNPIAADGDVVYVADHGSKCIRKVDALGNVTTVAGNPKPGIMARTGRGHRMKFFFDQFDIALAGRSGLYVVAGNEATNTRYSVYKVTFAP